MPARDAPLALTRANVTVDSWRRLTPEEQTAVESEAASLPLPDLRGPIRVRWAG